MAENREFLSVPEAAALMGISRIAVFKKVKKGQLPGIRIGRNWGIPASAIASSGKPAAPARPGRKTISPGPSHSPAVPQEKTAPEPLAPLKPEAQFHPERQDGLDEMGWD